MRKILLLLMLLCACSFCYAQEKVEVTLFHSPDCKACLKLKDKFLPAVKVKYGDSIIWNEVDIKESKENLEQFLTLSKEFLQEDQDPLVPSIYVGGVFLSSKGVIIKYLDRVLEDVTQQPSLRSPDILQKITLEDMFKEISLFTIVTSGLVDGVNPCAFAVIVFFISFLTVYGYRRRDLLCVGLSYCVAVYITYLLIGLGFFKFLSVLSGYYLAVKIFYIFIAMICFLLAVLSFYDYYKFNKTGSTKNMTLQLPVFLKKNIHGVIGKSLRDKKEHSAVGLIISAFVIGVLVSLLEAVCTGQVYVPTLVFILKSAQLRLKALFYLIIYNVMFVMPLVVIFLFAFFGISSQKLNEFLRKNVGILKIFLGFVFLFLGLFILFMDKILQFFVP